MTRMLVNNLNGNEVNTFIAGHNGRSVVGHSSMDLCPSVDRKKRLWLVSPFVWPILKLFINLNKCCPLKLLLLYS